MDTSEIIKQAVHADDDFEISKLLEAGMDPNFEGGWPIRLAARYGSYSIVNILLKCGANPHLLCESGASTLQLAVFSGKHWNSPNWTTLLSCCDSSQLADGAAVAIVFSNVMAVKKIIDTGRCNTNLPTTLTGKTLEQLAKGYKLLYLLKTDDERTATNTTPASTPRRALRRNNHLTPQPGSSRNLSPSVEQFFQQTANLTPTRNIINVESPRVHWVNY